MRRDLQICLLLILAVVGVYWPVYSYDFVLLDDHEYVFANRFVNTGLTGANIVHAMTGVTEGNWHPLTMLSHMIDCQLFGTSRPGMHHLVNLAMHVVNTQMVYRLFHVMTAARWPSAIVAALFGLHPLHVESVAWISERKDLLSTFFFLLMLLAYHGYARRPNVFGYMCVFTLLLLGLLSKPMVVTAPFVALLLDFWPLRRWRAFWRPMPQEPIVGLQIYDDASDETDGEIDDPETDHEAEYNEAPDYAAISETPQLPANSLGALVVEKIPLLALSIVFSVITYCVQRANGAMDMLGPHLYWYVRLGNAITSYGNYLSKTVFPTPLAVVYPYAQPRLVDTLILAAALVALIVASLRMARQRPYLIVGLLWFLGTLIPVIGLVQVGDQPMADRYTYIPLIGVFIIIAWGGAEFMAPWTVGQRTASALFMLGIFSLASFLQVSYWRDSDSLFRHAAEVPKNYRAHDDLGTAMWEQGNLDEAIDEFTLALKIQNAEPIFRKLGLVLEIRGKYADARAALSQAIKLQPNQPEPFRHLAWLMATAIDPSVRDGKRAIALAKQAIELDKSADPLEVALNRDTLAAAFAEAGDFAQAVISANMAVLSAQRASERELANEIAARGKLYEKHKPYHELLKRPRRI
jgi:Tfp pilus assembly protein PilF